MSDTAFISEDDLDILDRILDNGENIYQRPIENGFEQLADWVFKNGRRTAVVICENKRDVKGLFDLACSSTYRSIFTRWNKKYINTGVDIYRFSNGATVYFCNTYDDCRGIGHSLVMKL